jgi:hypothetical protein
VTGPTAPTPEEAREAFLGTQPSLLQWNFSPYSFNKVSTVYWHRLDDGSVDETLTVRLSESERVWSVKEMQRCEPPKQ